jgi:dipeptidyl aminopeptidase/acylaminoacyl peptidase
MSAGCFHFLARGDNLPSSTRVGVEQHKLFAEAVNNHGGDAEVVVLPEIGVFGNTHYVYADTNVNQVFALVSDWLKERGLDK